MLHQIWIHRSWKTSTGRLLAFRRLFGTDILSRLFLTVGSDSPESQVSQSTPWRLYDSATVPLFLTVPLCEEKNWFQITTLFMFSYIIHSKSLPTFWSLDDYHSSLLTQCLVFRFFPFIFFIFRSLSFLHISCVPVLSSFKDVFFEFHYFVIVLFSRIKLIVLSFDLSKFCGSQTWSLHAIPTYLPHCQFMPPKILPQTLSSFFFICFLKRSFPLVLCGVIFCYGTNEYNLTATFLYTIYSQIMLPKLPFFYFSAGVVLQSSQIIAVCKFHQAPDYFHFQRLTKILNETLGESK